jgi:hypothetical protein
MIVIKKDFVLFSAATLGIIAHENISEKYKIKNLSKIFNIDFEVKKVVFYMTILKETVFGEDNGDEKSNYDIFSMEDSNLQKFDDFLDGLNIVLIFRLYPSNIKQASNYD